MPAGAKIFEYTDYSHMDFIWSVSLPERIFSKAIKILSHVDLLDLCENLLCMDVFRRVENLVLFLGLKGSKLTRFPATITIPSSRAESTTNTSIVLGATTTMASLRAERTTNTSIVLGATTISTLAALLAYDKNTAIVVGTVSTVTLVALLAYDQHYVRKNPTVPGPRRWPFIGNMFSWLPKLVNGKDHEIRKEHHDTYGPIVSFSSFGMEGVDVADAEFFSQQFGSLKKTDLLIMAFKGLSRYGLFMLPSDEMWKRHRKYIQPGFAPSHLRNGVIISNHVINTLCSLWDAKFEQQGAQCGPIRVDLYRVASSISFDVIGHVAFSYSYDSVLNYETPEKQTALRSYNRPVEILAGRLGLPESVWWLFGVGVDQARREMVPVKEAIFQAIQAKRLKKSFAALPVSDQKSIEDKEPVPSTAYASGNSNLDVLDRLLEVEGWSDEEIVDEIIAIFLAGGETTANAIVFILFELARNSECLARARQEIDAILGRAINEVGGPVEATWEDIQKLPYLDSVIKESLRLHPPFTNLSGRVVDAKEGIYICGHHIQQGTMIIPNVLMVHTSPKYWPNPQVFDPERWTNFTPAPGTYIPFGDGPHKCVAFKLALLESKVTVARLIHRYNFKLVEDQKIDLVTTMTHGYKNGILFDVSRRD
ncbi:hypothetical protein HDV05_005032 [Chytridiales sp. JEL 0842]|nr:hypothetical protein HDV05_005032 [Chytridiales sp. JEL 0842]